MSEKASQLRIGIFVILGVAILFGALFLFGIRSAFEPTYTLETYVPDPDNVDQGTRVLFAAHYLERIGDRVTNVAEDVVFLATGETEDLNP